MIEDIIDNDEAYEAFRTRTKKFLIANPMTFNEFSLRSGVSRATVFTFMKKRYRGLCFKSISKMMNFMDNYKK
jgi:predicted transcriptional regulator